MRLVFKGLMVVLVVLGIGNYLVYLKTGSLPLMELRQSVQANDWARFTEKYTPQQLASRAKQAMDNLSFNQNDQSAATQVYKWTDANGQIHYSDQPINDQAEVVSVELRNAISPPDQLDPGAPREAQHQDQAPLEKARAAAEAINPRTREQESL